MAVLELDVWIPSLTSLTLLFLSSHMALTWTRNACDDLFYFVVRVLCAEHYHANTISISKQVYIFLLLFFHFIFSVSCTFVLCVQWMINKRGKTIRIFGSDDNNAEGAAPGRSWSDFIYPHIHTIFQQQRQLSILFHSNKNGRFVELFVRPSSKQFCTSLFLNVLR